MAHWARKAHITMFTTPIITDTIIWLIFLNENSVRSASSLPTTWASLACISYGDALGDPIQVNHNIKYICCLEKIYNIYFLILPNVDQTKQKTDNVKKSI